MQTKRLHIILHTFIPSLLFPSFTSRPCHLHLSTGRHPIIPILTFHMPKSIYSASPPQPRSEHPENCTNPHCVSYPSATLRTSISPSSILSSPDSADLLSSLPRFQSYIHLLNIDANYITLHYRISHAIYTLSDQWCFNQVINDR